jgi:hypothetical protein
VTVHVAQTARSLPAPLVVIYHAGASKSVLEAWPEATIVSESHPGFKNWYTHLGADGLASLDEILAQAGLTQADVSHIVLVGFSEGCQGVRTQMLAGVVPSAVLAVDGIHTRPEAWADVIARARAGEAAATVTHSSIQPGTYKSTTQIAAELIAPATEQPVENDGQPYPMIGLYQDGLFRVAGFAGADAPAHVYQGNVVLPRELAIIRDELAGVAAPTPWGASSSGSSPWLVPVIAAATVGALWWVLRRKR